MHTLSEQALAERSAILARHPEFFGSRWHCRLLSATLPVGLAILFCFGLLSLEISPKRLLTGTGEIGRIVALMLPPDYGSSARLFIYVHAMIETLAIAFL